MREYCFRLVIPAVVIALIASNASGVTLFEDDLSILSTATDSGGGLSGSRTGLVLNVDDAWDDESFYISEEADDDSDDYVAAIVSDDLQVTRNDPSGDGGDSNSFPDADDFLIYTRMIDGSLFEGLTATLTGAGSGTSMEGSDAIGILVYEPSASLVFPAKSNGTFDVAGITASSGDFASAFLSGTVNAGDMAVLNSTDLQPFEGEQFTLAVLVSFNNNTDESYTLDSVTVER